MKTKLKYTIVLLLAAALPLSRANANVNLVFNPAGPVSGAPGATVNITLQLVTTNNEAVGALDYWLAASGLSSGLFSIVATTRTSSDFAVPSANEAAVTSSGDTFNNSASSAAGSPDGTADNLIGPRNGPDLGATHGGIDYVGGTHPVGTFTVLISSTAAPGTYTISAFDYAGFGWSNQNSSDNAFNSLGSINITVVPEPATWSFIGLGVLALFGLKLATARRRA